MPRDRIITTLQNDTATILTDHDYDGPTQYGDRIALIRYPDENPGLPISTVSISSPFTNTFVEGNTASFAIAVRNAVAGQAFNIDMSGGQVVAADFTNSFTSDLSVVPTGLIATVTGLVATITVATPGNYDFTVNRVIATDALTEGAESISVALTNPTNGITFTGSTSTATTVTDGVVAAPSTVAIAISPSGGSINEGQSLTVTMTLVNAKAGQGFTLACGGLASIADFVGTWAADVAAMVLPAGVTVSVPNGTQQAVFAISANNNYTLSVSRTVVADLTTEPTGETVTFSLTSPTGGLQTSGGTVVVLNINDTSQTVPSTINLVSNMSTVAEGSTMTVGFNVVNGKAGQTVNFSSAGTNVSTSDFVNSLFTDVNAGLPTGLTAATIDANNVVITIATAGAYNFSLSRPIKADLLTEAATETVNFAISSPTNGLAISGTSSVVVTITDTSQTPPPPVLVPADPVPLPSNQLGTAARAGFDVGGTVETFTLTGLVEGDVWRIKIPAGNHDSIEIGWQQLFGNGTATPLEIYASSADNLGGEIDATFTYGKDSQGRDVETPTLALNGSASFSFAVVTDVPNGGSYSNATLYKVVSGVVPTTGVASIARAAGQGGAVVSEGGTIQTTVSLTSVTAGQTVELNYSNTVTEADFTNTFLTDAQASVPSGVNVASAGTRTVRYTVATSGTYSFTVVRTVKLDTTTETTDDNAGTAGNQEQMDVRLQNPTNGLTLGTALISNWITDTSLTPGGGGGGTLAAPYVGVDYAGGDFGAANYGNAAKTQFIIDNSFEMVRYSVKANRLFASPGGSFIASAMTSVDTRVNELHAAGILCCLDMHDYGMWPATNALVGTSGYTQAQFAKQWGDLATRYLGKKVGFGLMNEPHDTANKSNMHNANQAALAAIRAAGHNGLVCVPSPSNWAGAHDFVSSGNAALFLSDPIVDPANNWVLEVHQYLDSDNSGTHDAVVAGKGGTILSSITSWARANSIGKRLYLGEFGVARDAASLTELRAMMQYMKDNSDVWWGSAYWATGSFGQGYSRAIGIGITNEQLPVLKDFMAGTKAPG